MKPSFWKNLEVSLHDAIFDVMLCEGFSAEKTEQYFKESGEIRLTKTHGEKAVDGMNRITSVLLYFRFDFEGRTASITVHRRIK